MRALRPNGRARPRHLPAFRLRSRVCPARTTPITNTTTHPPRVPRAHLGLDSRSSPMFSPSSSARSNTVSPSAPPTRRTLLLGGLAALTAGCAAKVHPLSEEAKRSYPPPPPPRAPQPRPQRAPRRPLRAPRQTTRRTGRTTRTLMPRASRNLRMRSSKVGKNIRAL